MQQQQLTIEMIESKDFRQKPLGYDQKEVDGFLDMICDEMERQLNLIDQLQQDVLYLQRENDALKHDGVPQPEEPMEQPVRRGPDPQSVQAIFDEAVRFREQSLHESEIKAREIIEAAQQEANEIRSGAAKDADDQLAAIHEEYDRMSHQLEGLRQAAAEYRAAFRKLVEQQQDLMEEQAELFE